MDPIFAYSHQLLLVFGGLVLGLISPGPSFLVVTSAAINHRRMAIYTAIGCGCGTMFWAAATSFGLTTLLALFPNALNFIQLAGGSYLLWLGFAALRKFILGGAALLPKPKAFNITDGFLAWSKGILVHLTNPKAAMVWLALTSMAVTPETPLTVLMVIIFGSFAISASWHILLALIFSTAWVRLGYQKIARIISGIFAAFFLLLGGRLVWGLIKS